MRDFIPAGEDLDDSEKAHAANMRQLWQNGVYQDFIPAGEPEKVEKLDREGHSKQTRERRIERMRTAVQDEFEAAKRRLQNLTPAQAIEFIGGLPPKRMEMFLLAEEAIGGRKSVLSRFPAASPKARALFNVPGPSAIPTPESQPPVDEPEASEEDDEAVADDVAETESDPVAEEPEVEE